VPRVDVDEFKIQIVTDHKVRVEWRGQSDSGDLELDKLRLRTFEVLIGLLRRNRLLQVDELKILGEHLFVTLFGPDAASGGPPDDAGGPGALLRKAIRGDREHPDAGRRLLKVMLEIKAGSDRFGSWPWEYLYVPENPIDPNTGFFLGERTNFVLTRQLALVDSAPAIQVRPPLRILFVVLSPSDLPRIEYEAVLETLVQLRDAGGESRINLRVLTEEHGPDGTRYADPGAESRTTYRAFMDCVDQFDPHVIHIISHGQYLRTSENAPCGQLGFTREDSKVGWVGDQDLASMLMDISSLRLVFLQACETADTSSNPYQVISGVAQWLAQKNIPAVIAMHFLVESSLANEFARAFYKSLVERAAIEVAMHAARRQLYTSGVVGDSQRSGFGLPVLYLRGSGALLTPLESPTVSVEDPAGEQSAAADSLPSGPGLSRAWDGDIGIARHTA